MGRKPVAKRMSRTLKRIREVLRRRMHENVGDTARWLGKVLDGWLNYYAVPTAYRYLRRFVLRLTRMWLYILRRRSQKDRFKWARAIARPRPSPEPDKEIATIRLLR